MFSKCSLRSANNINTQNVKLLLFKGLIIAPDPTQLNSTQLAVELSWVGRVIVLTKTDKNSQAS